MKRNGDWIQTYSGLAFYPLDPQPEEICIEDIAHALSMQCRYTGHLRTFYSVAEHSVRVSLLCDPADALWGLLHDAGEAYLVDVARPIKRLPMMSAYRAGEADLQTAIALRFGLSAIEPVSIKRADMMLATIEARDLLPEMLPQYAHDWWERWQDWTPLIEGCSVMITRPWSPAEAEERFLARFDELTQAKPTALVSVAEAAAILGRHAAERRRLLRAQPVIEAIPDEGLFDKEAA